jgi:hypothetical protein
MSSLVKPLAVAAAACALAAGTAAAADAAKAPVTGTPAAAPAAGKAAPAASPALSAGAPRGYVIVSSGFLTANTGTQTRGTVTCPVGTVPFGGGAFVSSSSTAANINSSIPSGNGWLADINNASGFATTFDVYAICAKAPLSYQVVVSTVTTNPAFSQSTALAACPIGTKVLGGGGYSFSGSTAVNINTIIPSGNGWRTDMNNDTSAATALETYAVCGHKPRGYVVESGTVQTNGAGSETLATAACPAPTVPLSGGGFSFSGSPLVNMNTTAPISGGWEVYENNATTGATSIQAYVICAGTL